MKKAPRVEMLLNKVETCNMHYTSIILNIVLVIKQFIAIENR
jgi:hypothetical protein